MADIRAFAGFRYAFGGKGLSSVLCPPYDVIDADQAARLRREPRNAVHLELPEGDGEKRYVGAAAIWRDWIRSGILSREEEPSFYVVEERFSLGGRKLVRRGFLAALGATPKAARQVVPHERTLPKPKADRLKLLEAVGANVSPIFGLLPDPSGSARRVLLEASRSRPTAEGRTESGVRYRLWVVPSERLGKVARAATSRRVLIADGHHRFEVGRAFYLKHRGRGAETVLAYLCPDTDPGLSVLPTHRVVAPGSIDEDALASCVLSKSSGLGELLRRLDRERNPYTFGLFDPRGFRMAVPRSGAGCRSGLCVEWIGRRLLPKVPPDRIRYSHDAARAVAMAREIGGAAVFVKPCSVAQIREAVRRVGLLPPKSTYFYPKIATGLVFKSLEDA